jgi:hypothetical protein
VVAAYHRGNENSYDILDWDVNVEERLLATYFDTKPRTRRQSEGRSGES